MWEVMTRGCQVGLSSKCHLAGEGRVVGRVGLESGCQLALVGKGHSVRLRQLQDKPHHYRQLALWGLDTTPSV